MTPPARGSARGGRPVEATLADSLDPELSDERLAEAARALMEAARAADGRDEAAEYERWMARDEVREVLVREAWVRGRVTLRPVFEALFPSPEEEPELEDWFEGRGGDFASYREVLAGLEHADPLVRGRAARFFEQAARDEWSMQSALALGDPRIISRLLAAAADPDPEVQEVALGALGVLVPRTDFYDPDVFERVLRIHGASTTPAVRRKAILALMGFDDARRWAPLAAALAEKRLDLLSRKLLLRAVSLGARNAPAPLATEITERLFTLLSKEKKPDVQSQLVRALGAIADRGSIARLRAEARALGVRAELVEEASRAIEARAAPQA